MRIYLDNCCYNRPFDEQSQMRIFLESQAKMFIQDLVVLKELELVYSYMSVYENNDNPFENRRNNEIGRVKMRNNAVIMNDGVNCLLKNMGALETEAFISHILKEQSFDYTRWSGNLYSDLSLQELNSRAAEFVRKNYEKPVNVFRKEKYA